MNGTVVLEETPELTPEMDKHSIIQIDTKTIIIRVRFRYFSNSRSFSYGLDGVVDILMRWFSPASTPASPKTLNLDSLTKNRASNRH